MWSVGVMKPKARVPVVAGTIYIRDSSLLSKEPGDEGDVHGPICRELTGYQPSQINNSGGFVAGFSIQNGVIKYKSCSMNMVGPYGDPSDCELNNYEA